MEAAGLEVRLERYRFPRHEVLSSSFAVRIGGAPLPMEHLVLETSGSGAASGPVVFVNEASPADLAGVDLTGKVALVMRSKLFHRSAQYYNVVAAGAAAMISHSIAPENLIQVGSVKRTFEVTGPIPAITLGMDDARALIGASLAGYPIDADVTVAATEVPSTGTNVIGVIRGVEAGQILVGAHYDTWFAGATDNGAGVAALLALAERQARKPQPRHTLVFVAFDGEELALYGSYDYLHRHAVRGHDPILGLVNFETPSALGATTFALAHSDSSPLDAAFWQSGAIGLYPTYAPMEVVPELFGGIIPADVQGFYRTGLEAATTYVDSAYMHTTKDTPDKVDVPFLEQVVTDFDASLDALNGFPAEAIARRDPALWNAAVTTARGPHHDDPLVATVVVTDGAGAPQAGAQVRFDHLVDDFTLATERDARTDSNGLATIEIPAATMDAGRSHAYLHVTAGERYPLVERIVLVK
jgi:Zn-dependent M28 family amino/carboxypeptidase